MISSIKKNSYEISGWFEKHQKRIPVPLLSTVIIKDSGFKTSLSNLSFFPSGLNYLSKADLRNAPILVKKYFKKYYSDIPKLKKILLLASTTHTNPFYYEHLHALAQVLKKSSFSVEVATLEPLEKPVSIKTPSKTILKITSAALEGRRLVAQKFNPDFILLTDYFRADLMTQLSHIEQSMNPSYRVISKTLKKSDHLNILNSLAKDFSDMVGMDPWLLTTQYNVAPHVNFDERSGVEKIAQCATEILTQLEQKYTQYHINKTPAVQITNNSGTFGMGMITIKSIKELSELYHKKKSKKISSKGQSVMNDVLIQEDVPLQSLFKNMPGEVVVYLIGNEIAGGYIKTYTSDKISKNISAARELLFKPLTLTKGTSVKLGKETHKHTGLLYQNLSRIGGLALGYEIDRLRS